MVGILSKAPCDLRCIVVASGTVGGELCEG